MIDFRKNIFIAKSSNPHLLVLKFKIMKKVVFVLGLFISFTSCKKEIINQSSAENQQSLNSSSNDALTAAAVKNGALVIAGSTITDKINILHNLGVNYLRYTIIMSDWTGTDAGFERYTSEGLHIVCNINYDDQASKGQAPKSFTKDMVTYRKKLGQILDKYKPEVAVIENEETNKTYHTGPMSAYINELSNAVTVAHAKGVKVTNGGIHPQAVCYFVWKDYMDRGMTAEADSWMNLTFNSSMKYSAEHPEANNSTQFYWRQVDTLLNAYTTLNIDYVNMHIYEPINDVGNGKNTIPGCIATMASYIKRRTGKPAMSNECGQRNTTPSLVTSMLQAFTTGSYPYAIWFSGDGENTKALTEKNGVLRSNGVAYKNFVTK